mmetsp:Transcript_25864/g.48723  ORF Transcript_25864/g.48723 Transcript_25864/m.48723 type:complete len:264 (-) Transcript_25864:666-1457(-)
MGSYCGLERAKTSSILEASLITVRESIISWEQDRALESMSDLRPFRATRGCWTCASCILLQTSSGSPSLLYACRLSGSPTLFKLALAPLLVVLTKAVAFLTASSMAFSNLSFPLLPSTLSIPLKRSSPLVMSSVRGRGLTRSALLICGSSAGLGTGSRYILSLSLLASSNLSVAVFLRSISPSVPIVVLFLVRMRACSMKLRQVWRRAISRPYPDPFSVARRRWPLESQYSAAALNMNMWYWIWTFQSALTPLTDFKCSSAVA